MAKIIGIGANVFDTLYSIDKYPTEDTKTCASAVKECGGGPCATGLVAASKLGASCGFIGNYTDDSAGQFLKSDFEKYGVDTSYMTYMPGYSSFLRLYLFRPRYLSQEQAFQGCHIQSWR